MGTGLWQDGADQQVFHSQTRKLVTILTTNLAAVVCVCVWMCVSVQNLTNFCPHALISNPNVPKILFA